MFINDINPQKKEILISIPLTTTSGKVRVKKRSTVFEYGQPHAPKREPFTQNNYVEWQIGYDIDCKDIKKLENTTLPNKRFVGYDGKEKALYELTEYLYYFRKWGVIKSVSLTGIQNEIASIKEKNLIESNEDCQIKRTHPNEKIINNINFYKSKVEYPLLVHKFGKYEIIAEIIVREKQRAIGTQAMLYFCFPITELISEDNLLGRTADTKESALFLINSQNAFIITELIRIFGMLSSSHQKDILSIIELAQKT